MGYCLHLGADRPADHGLAVCSQATLGLPLPFILVPTLLRAPRIMGGFPVNGPGRLEARITA